MALYTFIPRISFSQNESIYLVCAIFFFFFHSISIKIPRIFHIVSVILKHCIYALVSQSRSFVSRQYYSANGRHAFDSHVMNDANEENPFSCSFTHSLCALSHRTMCEHRKIMFDALDINAFNNLMHCKRGNKIMGKLFHYFEFSPYFYFHRIKNSFCILLFLYFAHLFSFFFSLEFRY